MKLFFLVFCFILYSLTLLGPGGGGGTLCPPCHVFNITLQIHVQACWKKLTFPNYKFGKGQYTFYPIKLARFGEKKYSASEILKIHKGGPLQTGLHSSWPTKKIEKSNIILEGSRHPTLMNPFEYGKSFHNKLFPKRIGTLTPPNPKILGGGEGGAQCAPSGL